MTDYKTYITLDFETTGLKPDEERITQIAAIKVLALDEKFFFTDENEVEAFDKFVTLVNPEKEISEFITNLTGIDNEKVKDAPKESEAIEQLIRFIDDSKNPVIVAQNAPFDLGFLHHATLRAGLVPKTYNFYCTRAMSAVLFPNLSHRLVDIIKLFDIELNQAHDALNDSTATLQLFANLMPTANLMGINFMNKLVHHDDREMLFEPKNKIILPALKKR